MQDLTFGEQVKIVLSRKNMTIKELAKKIEVRTKKKMSRQNLTQRLGRDNFQEQDMRMIAEILGCPFQLDILGDGLSAERVEAAEMTETITAKTESEEGLKIEEPTKEGEEEQTENRIEEASEEKPEKTDSDCDGAERPDEKKTAAVSHERDITIGELVDIHEELDAMMEKAAGEQPKQGRNFEDSGREERPKDAYEPERYGDSDLQSGVWQEETAEEELSAVEGEPIEKILEEIESMESEDKKEDRPEEKPEDQTEKQHGWRAYLMQRFKKKGKPGQDDETRVEKNFAGDKHTGNDYVENSSGENDYVEDDYAENIYQEEEYSEDKYQMYAGDSPEAEYVENLQLEEEYLQEIPREEEGKGECNPYTGKEYESNSVRMHPSRIGYVQVYDRSNHEWTDMTEWAFLGYQERKKQLLGKDYDPPIYLD